MKRLIVNLLGTVTYSATRSFVLEVPDDVDISTIDQGVLETLADDAMVAWEFHADGFVQMTEHSIEEASESVQENLLVIPLEEKVSE